MEIGFNEDNNIKTKGESIEHYFTESLVNPLIVIKKNNITNPFSLIDSDFSLGKLNKPFIPNQIPIMVSPELLVINYSLIKNFPKFIKPIIYAWHDATEENQQAFNATLLKYFKNTFSKISSNMGFISLSTLYNVQIETISKLRNDFSTGRIIFHHIGYGFPQLTADSIYLSDNIQIPPKLLFILLTPPTFYIFDCDNAGSILPVFESIAISRSIQNWQDDSNRQKDSTERCFSPFQFLTNSVNWSDYFCLCATSPGEELPRDPNLPRDFFTSLLFSPVETAFLCQVYLAYRTTIAMSDIPRAAIDELEELLDVIVDGIVCECLPGSSLHLFFRTDKVVHRLFRNFVLAQYVLKPFGVHPVSSPPLPDMSSNQLWEQWRAAVDNSVGVFAMNRSPSRDYFERALTSFNYLVSKGSYGAISPSLITALLRSANYGGPARLIIDNPASLEVVASIAVVGDIFVNLIRSDPRSRAFSDILLLAAHILRFDMNRVCEVPADLDWRPLVEVVFDDGMEAFTRVLAMSVVAACVPYNRALRQICTDEAFARRVKDAVAKETAQPFLAKWLFITFKRAYDVFSARPCVFLPNGLHVQAAICALHYSHEVRASALSCLSCFMQGGDTRLDLRLLLSAMHCITDMSYLVRHQLLMLILRYLTAHHDVIEAGQQLSAFDFSSFRSLSCSVFSLPDADADGQPSHESVAALYRAVERETASRGQSSAQRVGQLIQFAVTYFAYDPHPAIAAEAASAREFFFRSSSRKSPASTASSAADNENEEEDYSGSDSLTCIPFESDSDALYHIAVRQMLEKVSKSGEKRFRSCFPSDNWSKQSGVSLKVECPLYGRPSCICFDSLSTGVIVAGDNDITYYDDNLNIVSSVHIGASFTTDVKSASWFNESLAIVACGSGCVHVFRRGDGSKRPSACFRADPNIMAASIPLFISPANDRPRLATVRGTSHAVIWDVEAMRVVQEVPPEKNLPFLARVSIGQPLVSSQMSPFLSSSSSSSSFSPSIHPDFDAVIADVSPVAADTSSLLQPNATSIAVHPSNSSLLMVGYENGYATITDTRANLPVETLCISGADDQSPVIKVAGNVDGNSTFFAVSRNGACVKWSPTPSPFTSVLKRKFSMPSIRTNMGNLSAEGAACEGAKNERPAPEKAAAPNARRVSLFVPSTAKDKACGNSILSAIEDGRQQPQCARSNITAMCGVDVHDFDAHQILPIIAFAPESLNEQLIMNESTARVQKVKMDPASSCVFHPTQPICALASGKKLKIFRL